MGGMANSQMETLSTRELAALQNSAGADPLKGALSGQAAYRRQPSLTAYEPTVRDSMRAGLADIFMGLGANKHRARGMARGFGELAEYSPLGLVTAAEDATAAFGRGEYGEAWLAALGAIPGFKPVKAVRRLPAQTHLPMDQAARMGRAKELGFRLEEPLYHGTGADFDEFDPAMRGSTTGTETARQAAAWLTTDPGLASSYAKSAAEGNQGSAAVMPLFHRAKKSGEVILEGSDTVLEVAATLADAFDDGYDAVKFKNFITSDGPKTILAVKDPNQLRSRFATFDPAKIDSRNLLASLAAVGGLSVVVSGDEQEK
jgi:hypothetical protein